MVYDLRHRDARQVRSTSAAIEQAPERAKRDRGDATRAPVQDLREFGRTDKPEAEEAKMAEKYMKESTEPNVVAQFQSRLDVGGLIRVWSDPTSLGPEQSEHVDVCSPCLSRATS